jgi:hypothetical protein
VAAAFSIIGGVIGMLGALQAAEAQKQAALYNAAVEERNRLAVLAQADSEAISQSRENQRRLGTIRAAYGKSGIDLAGSPLDVIQDTAIEQEFDIANIRYAGEVKAIGHEDAATLARMEAKNATTAGMFSAAGALFGGFSQAGVSLMRTV